MYRIRIGAAMLLLLSLAAPVAALAENDGFVVTRVAGGKMYGLARDNIWPLPAVVVDREGRRVTDLELRVPVVVRLEGDSAGERLVVLDRWRGNVAR